MNLQEQCPVCTIKQFKYLFSVKIGQLVKCNNCHLIYYTPQPSLRELEEFYNSETYRSEFSESLMSGPEFATNRYLQFEKSLKKYVPQILTQSSRKLLDIGCGTGHFLKVAEQHSWEVEGIEISSKAAQDASKKIHGEIFVGDLLSIDFSTHNYDVITLYHVIEHLLDPICFLRRIKELLKPNGILFLETPNINSIGFKLTQEKWSHLIPPEHIIYFQPDSLSFALKKTDFTSNYIYTISPQIIESLQKYPHIVQNLGKLIYKGSCIFNMGPTLQAIAMS